MTDAGLGHLHKLKELWSLDLSHTRVTGTGLAYLAHLERLRLVNLSGTPVTHAGLEILAKLPSLRSLDLAGTQLADDAVEYLAKLSVEDVDLSQTKMSSSGIAKLAQLCPKLTIQIPGGSMFGTTLRVDDQGTDTLLRDFAQTGAFRWIHIYSSKVTDAGLAALTGQKKIERLSISDASVFENSSLRYLHRITDAGLKHLGRMPALRSVHLSGDFTDAGLRHLSGLSDLQSLTISSRKITGIGLEGVLGLEKLSRLELNYCPITDAGLNSLSRFSGLTALHLQRTHITDAGLAQLKSLANLKEVNVAETGVTGEGLKHLTGLKHLRRLSIFGNGVSRNAAAAWQEQMPYTTIIIDGRDLEGEEEPKTESPGTQPANL